MAAAIFRIITDRRPGAGGDDMAAGLEWSEPTGIMMAWRRSLVTITVTGVATLSKAQPLYRWWARLGHGKVISVSILN